MLTHAPWADPWTECTVLDGFAGSGALGLEALSRGAARAVFFETDRAALESLRANVVALGAASRCAVIPADATRPPRMTGQGGCTLVFLDPPYGRGLIARSLGALRTAGWIAASALIVAESAREESAPVAAASLLAERRHGAARLSIWREGPTIDA